MLCCLGPVAFDVKNDLQSIDFDTQSNFARHEVMGAAPVYEDTGDGESTITLSGTLLPFFFTGALQGISLLEAARRQKVPLTMIRGDFTPMGWVLIDSISHSRPRQTQSISAKTTSLPLRYPQRCAGNWRSVAPPTRFHRSPPPNKNRSTISPSDRCLEPSPRAPHTAQED